MGSINLEKMYQAIRVKLEDIAPAIALAMRLVPTPLWQAAILQILFQSHTLFLFLFFSSSPIKLGTNQHGVLNSDNWPNQYSLSQKECEYRIELKTGQQITFFFIQVSLNYGYDDNCNEDDDFIKIRGRLMA